MNLIDRPPIDKEEGCIHLEIGVLFRWIARLALIEKPFIVRPTATFWDSLRPAKSGIFLRPDEVRGFGILAQATAIQLSTNQGKGNQNFD